MSRMNWSMLSCLAAAQSASGRSTSAGQPMSARLTSSTSGMWQIQSIQEIATTIGNALKKASPKKASVTFGLEVALQSGKLTSLLVQGSGTATLNVTLEWGS